MHKTLKLLSENIKTYVVDANKMRYSMFSTKESRPVHACKKSLPVWEWPQVDLAFSANICFACSLDIDSAENVFLANRERRSAQDSLASLWARCNLFDMEF